MSDAPTPETQDFWATFNAREGWAECDGVRYQGHREGWIVRPLCELLVAAGHADGVLNFRDATSGQRHFWVQSIHRAAAGPERKTREEHIEELKVAAALRREKIASGELVVRTKPIAPKIVRVVNTAPIERKFIFVTVGEETVRVNPKHREAFEVITKSPKTWETAVHPKTRNYLVNVKWVAVYNGVPTLTEIGGQIAEAATVATQEAA